jgi:chromosome segregation protein
MRIKELQLYGFKSFPHKTAIRFSAGMSAIIGPNGCGKSNVLDALRWVLGEQSFSLLRCSKNEDIIFSGTAQIPALGYAEVRLILDNAQAQATGSNPELERSEIEIRRRYFRSGESEYYVNRNQCRLKDVQDVFFDSGTGTKAYSIFDLRSLRQIIAGELRPMLEEAATLAKYRQRKTDCLRKLELTDTDLTRLNDIVAERERITRSLKRQAYRLSAYSRLKEEEKRLRLLLLREQYRMAREQEQAAAQALAASEQFDAQLLETLQKAEAELATLHQDLATGRDRREQLNTEAEELRGRLNRNESQRQIIDNDLVRGQAELGQLADEEAALEAQLAHKRAENEQRRQNVGALEQQETALAQELEQQRSQTRGQEERLLEIRKQVDADKSARRDAQSAVIEVQRRSLAREAEIANARDYQGRLKTELEGLERRTRQSEVGLEQETAELAVATRELEQARAELTAERGRLETAQARLDELNRTRQQLREELASARQELSMLLPGLDEPRRKKLDAALGAQLLGSVSDFLTVPQELERAVEAALYSIVDGFVLKSESRLAEMLAGLEREARWKFIIESAQAGAAPPNPGTPEPLSPASFPDSLAALVQFKDNAPGQLRQTLAQTVLVDSLVDAVQRYSARLPPTAYRLPQSAVPDPWPLSPASFVTRDGILLQSDGVLVLESAGQGKLTVERRVRELGALVAGHEQQAGLLDAEQAELSRSQQELRGVLDSGDRRLLQIVNRQSGLEATRAAGQRSHEELLAELNRQRTELRSVSARLAEQQGALQTARDELQRHEAQAREAELRSAALEQSIGELELGVRAGLDQAAGILLNLTRAREQLSSRRTEFDLYAQDCLRDEQRRAQIVRRREEIQSARTAHETGITRLSAEDEDLKSARNRLEMKLAQVDLSVMARREEELMKSLHDQREAQEQSRRQTLDRKLKSLEAGHRVGEIEQEAERLYGSKLAEFSGEPEPEVENRLRLITERLDRLGRVNPLAGDEFDREKTELDRLTTQRADVLAAKENLLKTVAEIDRFACEQFVATFNTVREAFREIFARLFVEGEADLLLDAPTDPLESEISIIAKPKGKSPKRLDQLSDGEKALLALSLLFAFYRVKPAPFCFLDEVDAPLDDANVDRFAMFLKELSHDTQVIIITHNRATVEQADVLFGVTTEAPGVSKIVSVKLGDIAAQQAVGGA